MVKYLKVLIMIIILLTACGKVDMTDESNSITTELEISHNNLKRDYLALEAEISELKELNSDLENLIGYKDKEIKFLTEEVRNNRSQFIVSKDKSLFAYIREERSETGKYWVEIIGKGNGVDLSIEALDILPFDRAMGLDERINLSGFSSDKEYLYGSFGDGQAVSAPFSISIIDGVAIGYLEAEPLIDLVELHPYE